MFHDRTSDARSCPFARHGLNSYRPSDRTTNQPFGIRSEILKVASALLHLSLFLSLSLSLSPSLFPLYSPFLRLSSAALLVSPPAVSHQSAPTKAAAGRRRSTSGGREVFWPPLYRARLLTTDSERLPKEFKLSQPGISNWLKLIDLWTSAVRLVPRSDA